MSDIKAMMKAAQDKEDEVLAKFNEFDLDGDRGIDEVRTRHPHIATRPLPWDGKCESDAIGAHPRRFTPPRA
jgi:hypothetical protein